MTDLEVVGHLMLVMGSEGQHEAPLVPSAQTAWKNQEGASRKMQSEVSERPTLRCRDPGPAWGDT